LFVVFVCTFPGHCRLQILCGRLASVGLAQARPNKSSFKQLLIRTAAQLLNIVGNEASSFRR